MLRPTCDLACKTWWRTCSVLFRCWRFSALVQFFVLLFVFGTFCFIFVVKAYSCLFICNVSLFGAEKAQFAKHLGFCYEQNNTLCRAMENTMRSVWLEAKPLIASSFLFWELSMRRTDLRYWTSLHPWCKLCRWQQTHWPPLRRREFLKSCVGGQLKCNQSFTFACGLWLDEQWNTDNLWQYVHIWMRMVLSRRRNINKALFLIKIIYYGSNYCRFSLLSW